MYSLINANQDFLKDDAISNHFEKYIEILDIDNCLTDTYKKNYKNFWAMYAALNLTKRTDFDDIYFEYIKNRNKPDFKELLNLTKDLTKIGFQYSFATKAAHMLDNNLPIFDIKIKEFYYFKNINSKDWSGKLELANEQYSFLIKEYQRIQDLELLKPTIDKIDNILEKYKIKDREKITNTKKIDTIIWSWVTFLKEGAITSEKISWS